MASTVKLPFINQISFLCALQIPLLVSGPFLPDLMLSILSIFFLIFCIRNSYYDKFKNIYFIIFVTFCITIIVSSLLSNYVYFSLKSSLFYIRIGIFALLISYLIDKNKKILNYF